MSNACPSLAEPNCGKTPDQWSDVCVFVSGKCRCLGDIGESGELLGSSHFVLNLLSRQLIQRLDYSSASVNAGPWPRLMEWSGYQY